MTEGWTNKVFDCTDTIIRKAGSLRTLAECFRRVGNEAVADELHGCAYELEKAADAISKEMIQKTSTDLKQAQTLAGQVLQVALKHGASKTEA